VARSPARAAVVPRGPASKADIIACRFVQRLQVADPRYDLWLYGPFLVDIPRQLGSNDALDAAMDTFSTTLAVLHTRAITDDMRAKYVEALAALRNSLDNPSLATSSSTLYAIFLLVVTQVRVPTLASAHVDQFYSFIWGSKAVQL
jgi:hypothetical protein